MKRTIDDVAEQLRTNKDTGQSCVLLIGAGCSIEAGIPRASKFVDEIRKRYPRKWESAKEKTYPACMAQLTSNERHKLISDYIDGAKINWAHVAIAQLMEGKFVDRVLTTNFDPLVMQASALFNIFPAVYDMVSIGEEYRASWVRDKAVFHLHGQRDGFFQAHTEEHVNALESRLGNLFRDCASRRTWIVVGYSGENDPVFRQLEAMSEFDNDLYWISYQEPVMPPHLEPLIRRGKGAYWINDDRGADNFLYQLADRVGCPPPPFFAKPFTHLRQTLNSIASFKLPGQEAEVPVTQDAIVRIDKAIRCIEPSPICSADGTNDAPAEAATDLAAKAKQLLMAGKYNEIIAMADALPPAAADTLAWAHTMLGNTFHDEAMTSAGAEADDLWLRACEKHAQAIAVKPDMHEALYNWGIALADWAKAKAGAEADDLRTQACEKYAQALAVKPDKHEALNNWGWTLTEWARTRSGAEADDLRTQACEKYAQAVAVKPDKSEALDNWGLVLLERAKARTGAEAADILGQAEEKFHQANAALAGKGSYNLACIAALRGQPEECRRWLEDSLAHGYLPDRKHLTGDSDLDGVRGEPWFAEILAKAKE